MNDMYCDIIIDYYRNPKNKFEMKDSDAMHKDVNPLCGDEITIHLKLHKNIIKKATFTGSGCAISQASVSMLCEHIEGKTIDEVLKLNQEYIIKMLGIKLTPARLKCALLGMHVMRKALHEYEKKK